MNLTEAQAKFRAELPRFQALGVVWDENLPIPASYLPDEFRNDAALAMDAQPALASTPNAGIPSIFTTFVDPKVFQALFAKNNAAVIFGEQRRGTWTDDTTLFPFVEHAGEVTSYGDYAEGGTATANANWPMRQNYIFQTMKQWGDREVQRAGKARLNWISEIDASAATQLNKFLNLMYFYGISQLQNFGLLNDPGLTAFITPAPKAAGGNTWITGTVVTATANEIFTDIQSLFLQLVNQSSGLINNETKITLAMSPGSRLALTATNSFNVNVKTLLKENFPNIRFEDAVQYAVSSTSNPQGNSLGGNIVQMIADVVEGQEAGYCAYSERMRSHPIIRGVSSFKQKVTSGGWGAVIRQGFNLAQMIGV
jgi:hypothetical protein